jgi:hypothetical protein
VHAKVIHIAHIAQHMCVAELFAPFA